MGDSVEIATCEILTDRHANLAQGPAHSDTLEPRTGRSELRMQGLESGLRQDRRNAAGMLAMMRATAGDLDARVSEVEQRVAALEGRAG